MGKQNSIRNLNLCGQGSYTVSMPLKSTKKLNISNIFLAHIESSKVMNAIQSN